MLPMPAHWQESDDDDFDTHMLDYSAIEGGFDESEASNRALQGIGSGSIVPGRRKAQVGTANFVHVYREFCSCLPRILSMFTANFVHVYREFCSCLPRISFMFTANFVHVYREFRSCLPRILFMFTANFVHVYREFRTFRQADSSPTRGGMAPAGPIKNIFSAN